MKTYADVEREYRKTHKLICGLYATHTPVRQIERLLYDLERARKNDLRRVEGSA